MRASDRQTPIASLARASAGSVSAPAYQHAYSGLTCCAAFAFAVVLGFSRLSYGLLLPALRADLHGSYGLFGLVGVLNLGGYLVGTLATPLVVARYRDRVRLNTLSLLAMSAAMIASATSLDLAQLGAWRLLVGLFSAPATVLTITLTLERVAPAERGRASGMIFMGGAAGVVVSGLVAPLVVAASTPPAWRLVWAAMGLTGLVATRVLRGHLRATALRTDADTVASTGRGAQVVMGGIVEARRRVATERVVAPEPASPALATLLHPRGLLTLTLAYAAFGCGYIIYFTFFIALIVHQGVPAPLVGLVWSAIGAIGGIGGVLWGRAIDRWPSGFTLAIALATGALGALGVGGLALDGAGAVLMGICFIGTPTMFTALLRRAVPAAHYAVSLSLLTAAFALGQMVGPLIGGVVADAHGLALGTASSSGILAAAALLAFAYGVAQRYRSWPV